MIELRGGFVHVGICYKLINVVKPMMILIKKEEAWALAPNAKHQLGILKDKKCTSMLKAW